MEEKKNFSIFNKTSWKKPEKKRVKYAEGR